MDALKTSKKLGGCLIIFLLISGCFMGSAFAENSVAKRSFALELEYGSGAFHPLPLTDLGSSLYGSNISGNPFGGNIIYVFGPGLIAGVDYRSYGFAHDKGVRVNDPQYVINNKVNITQVTAFLDLSPFMHGKEIKDSITKGFFIEAGPSLTQISEEFIMQESGIYPTGKYSFSAQGIGLDIRMGFRTMSKEPLSFLARVKINIPIAHDNKKSETGLGLNGAASYSFNAGFCLSF